MTGKRRALSYDVVQVRDITGPRTIARLWCAQCGDTLDITLNSAHHADGVERMARTKGWECDKNRPRRTLCPDCKARPRVAPKPELSKSPVPLRPVVTKPVFPIVMETPMTSVRPATPDERMRIRHKLDEVFDDSKGMYLDGYSDQRVADGLNLPRKMIEQIREAAYGPIRTDPEIEQLRTDIASLVSQASTLANRLADVEKRYLAR
ncbi:MAG: hypothetical protein HQL42_17785 [Alphaproteobacteria bacterium]|nr:hypothetical protein [Alphaproteobacteria bacterium]